MRRAIVLCLAGTLLAGFLPRAGVLAPRIARAASPEATAVEADDADDADAAGSFIGGKGRRGGSRGPMLLVLRIAEALHLSDEQTIKVAAEFRRVAQQRRELIARRVALAGKLESQLAQKPRDDAALTSLTEQLVAIEQEINRLPEGLWKSIQPVLTPEQSARLVLLRGKLKQQVDGERKARRGKGRFGGGPD
jgi:Spy/CpxP family protein refolding chaperone